MNTITFDRDKCIQCGLCADDCVAKCISMNQNNYPYMKDENRCLGCQHCLAICPKGAITFNDKKPENSEKK